MCVLYNGGTRTAHTQLRLLLLQAFPLYKSAKLHALLRCIATVFCFSFSREALRWKIYRRPRECGPHEHYKPLMWMNGPGRERWASWENITFWHHDAASLSCNMRKEERSSRRRHRVYNDFILSDCNMKIIIYIPPRLRCNFLSDKNGKSRAYMNAWPRSRFTNKQESAGRTQRKRYYTARNKSSIISIPSSQRHSVSLPKKRKIYPVAHRTREEKFDSPAE